MDYKNGKIYTIRSHQTDKIYIGSTTQPLSKRLSSHKGQYKSYLNGKKKYITSLEIIKYGDAYIELLEKYPCDNKMMLHKREGECIRNEPNCVNKFVPGRTTKQYREEHKGLNNTYNHSYYKDNRDKIKEQAKQYRELNRDTINAKQNKYRELNRDKIKEQAKQYRELNRDTINANQKKYREQKKMEENILT